MAKSTATVTVTMKLERETKNTYRFSAPDSVCETLYVAKTAFPDGAPATIKLMIEAA